VPVGKGGIFVTKRYDVDDHARRPCRTGNEIVVVNRWESVMALQI